MAGTRFFFLTLPNDLFLCFFFSLLMCLITTAPFSIPRQKEEDAPGGRDSSFERLCFFE